MSNNPFRCPYCQGIIRNNGRGRPRTTCGASACVKRRNADKARERRARALAGESSGEGRESVSEASSRSYRAPWGKAYPSAYHALESVMELLITGPTRDTELYHQRERALGADPAYRERIDQDREQAMRAFATGEDY